MFYSTILMACLFSLPQGRTEPRTSTRRYKPLIQVTEEININDITFTTSAPDFERSSSHKALNYYNNIKGEGAGKGGPYSGVPDTGPGVFPRAGYKDSYGAVAPADKAYGGKQPIVVPALKYKPYKVYKVQEAPNGFRPAPYKVAASDKGRPTIFEPPPTTYSAIGIPESPKQYSSKLVPFSSNYLPTKASTNYQPPENRNFIPSQTFSPTVLAQISNEGTKKLSELAEKKEEKTRKKAYHIKKPKKVYENHNAEAEGIKDEDFSAGQEKLEQNLGSYKDSPQQSESFLSEISTLHKGGSGGNNLDGLSDSDLLDLKTGERVEFQMYGMDGPQSYKFGFDTGKGQNRHFRFEERDNTGKVKGHYGYLDEDGKMRIMKYEADPITGFHAGPVEISPDEN